MNDVKKLALFVACVAGYAIPAIALDGRRHAPVTLASAARIGKADCRDVRVFSGNDAVDARDVAATDDGNGGCTVSATVSPKR